MPTVAAMKRAVALILLVVAACSGADRATMPDNQTDPAIAEALAGPLMSDMQMGGAASPDALRPGEQPATLPVPLDARIDTAGAPTLGQVSTRVTSSDAAFAGCSALVSYSAMRSLKLPAPLALPKDARLVEAGGSDRPGCSLGVVRFALPGAPASTRARYETAAKREGFAVTTTGNTVTGVRARDGMAFRIETALSKDGTRVDLVARSR